MQLHQTIHSPLPSPQALPVLENTCAHWQAADASGELNWRSWVAQDADIAEILQHAQRFRQQCSHVVLCGTGGSSLSAEAFLNLTQHPLGLPQADAMNLYVLNSTEEHVLRAALHDLPPEKTGWIFISRSGQTLETLKQCSLYLEHSNHQKNRCALVITMTDASPLRSMAEQHGIPIALHPRALGGRFSTFSIVGMLPAALLGLDIVSLRAGARRMLREGMAMARDGAAWHWECMQRGKSIHVILPYASRLRSWTYWYRQLWAESLGKNGQGSTPFLGLGPLDQHSILQLFLDGPTDKSMTTIAIGPAYVRPQGGPSQAAAPLDFLHNSGTDILRAQAYATIQSFLNHQIPLREWRLPDLKEESIGELLMLSMMETVLTAQLLGVNAFDQPAVEESKQLTLQLLHHQQRACAQAMPYSLSDIAKVIEATRDAK